VTVGDVYRALWRHKIFIVLLTTCMVAGVFAAISREQKVYTASALIRIEQNVQNPNDLYGALQTGGRLAQTYEFIVGTTTIAERIATALHGRVPYAEIAGNVGATQVQDLDLLTIDAKSTDPSVAAAIANAAPAALKAYIRTTATLGDEIIPVQRATVPTAPSSPKKKLDLAIALLLGLLVNGTLALLIDLVGDRVAELDEFEEIAGAPVLGLIPTLELTVPASSRRLVPTPPPLDAVKLEHAESSG
jgi:protein tyrosine kinase modulator